ncbi:STAS domain-containing protein [Streptomyces sp. NPDC126514]|uniref:STAS domain-containing protein n=1 Tax=Streptomyces sp. NPDC126514 TaxID=3155210 RepID=UPI003325D79C
MSDTDITTIAEPGRRQAMVTVAGELDILTAPDVRQALTAAATVYEETVVDLARLAFCDCAGLGALISARNTARRRGTHLRWQHIPEHLQWLLRATGTRLTGTSPPPAGTAPLTEADSLPLRPACYTWRASSGPVNSPPLYR